jgi:hypothetical protein
MTALDVTTTPQQHAWTRPRPILWLHVLARRSRLDRILAEGHPVATSHPLAVRAQQLMRARARARLAAAFYEAVQSIEEPRPRGPQVPVDAVAVRACGDEIRNLAHALTDPHPRVRGVALARNLLTDGTGPLYGGGAGDLRSRIFTARSAL